MVFNLAVCLAVFGFNFVWVLWLNKAPKEIWQNLWGLPLFVFNLLIGAAKMKRSNKDFMVTTNTSIQYIDEVLKLRDPQYLKSRK